MPTKAIDHERIVPMICNGFINLSLKSYVWVNILRRLLLLIVPRCVINWLRWYSRAACRFRVVKLNVRLRIKLTGDLQEGAQDHGGFFWLTNAHDGDEPFKRLPGLSINAVQYLTLE